MLSLASDPYEYLAEIKFHRTLRTDRGRRVTYADCGSRDAEAPVILFIYGLSGHRLHAAYHDGMLATKGLRLIVVDRPGIGGSDAVDASDRFQAFVESVLHLLHRENITKLALVSQSGGLLYLLSLLLALPERVSCKKAYLVSPFVPKNNADSRILWTFGTLSSFALSHLHNVIPPVTSTLSAIGTLKSHASSLIPFTDHGTGDILADWFTEQSKKPSHERTYYGRYLSPIAQYLISSYITQENLEGTSQDALLLMEKEAPLQKSWGYGNYGEVFHLIDEKVKGQKDTPSLSVTVYWGTADGLVGPGGKAYLERAISEVATAGSGSITFLREDIPGGGHGDILNRDCVLGQIAEELAMVSRVT